MYIYSGLLILCLQIYGGKRWTITTITATREDLEQKLAAVDYKYDDKLNRFV